ncbi:MAG: hypothetical protein K0S15_860 [Solirubrobacterales bacterium]|nr:hypothetical protein [Solirubrobacterales bacterium]
MSRFTALIATPRSRSMVQGIPSPAAITSGLAVRASSISSTMVAITVSSLAPVVRSRLT